MSLVIDKKYANLVAFRLEKFKWKDGVARFRCPLCGDSKKNKFKCRGGFYPSEKGDYLRVGCFNCNHKYTIFGKFLEKIDPPLYGQYLMEIFRNKNEVMVKENAYTPPKDERTARPKKPNPLDFVPSIASLPQDHPAVKYLAGRKIPSEMYSKLFYTDNYKKWINQCVSPDKFSKYNFPDERIIIPYFASNGKPYAYQGRYIGMADEAERYITINPNPNKILLYGVERIDDTKPVKVVEGAFDSFFIPNCVAVGGSALTKLLKYDKLKLVFIFDNEPRSPEICELMERVIDAGKDIVIWPSSVDGLKDINKMVENNYNVVDIVNDNVYTGAIAGMRYQMWKKI